MALPVSSALALPISLDRLRVGLPVLARIVGVSAAPFLLAVPADLVVLGVGVELAAVIFSTALPLAIGSAANKLVGMITGELKQLLTVAAAAVIHQGGSESGCEPSIVTASLQAIRNTRSKWKTKVLIRSMLARSRERGS